jgi:hypothetical protein
MKNRSPDYWTGSGCLPRVAMRENVLIAVYKIPHTPGLYMKNRYNFTHAYFPKAEFDEVVEEAGWVFGRKGKGYIALFSRNGYRWRADGADRDAEIIADGRQNIWICEMGREETNGSFREFQNAIASVGIEFRNLSVTYASPSCGEARFGWKGGFVVNGKEVPLRNRLRYENLNSQTQFDPRVIKVRKGSQWLKLEFDGFGRSFSATI